MKNKRQIGSYIGGYHRGYIWDWWKFPYDLYRELKAFYKRGMYGWADCDTWSLDVYLASWLPDALESYKDDHVLHRFNVDLMIDGFKAAQEQEDYETQEEWEELEKRRLKGMTEFVKHYNALWN